MRNQKQHRGLTLVECLLASVILAFAVVAVSQAVLAGQMQTADALHRARALELTEALMEEVTRLPYTDPNGGTEVGRANYDNLQDFNGFSETTGTLKDAAGVAYDSAFQGFSRTVSVVPDTITVTGFGNPLPGLTTTVTVQDAGGASWVLTRFRAQPPP